MSKKILVVDDSKVVRQQLAMALGSAGYSVVEAEDGQYGLDALKASGDIAMVISDVNMPRMDGLQMLEAIKGANKAGPPVMMLTTEGNPVLIDRAKKAGAVGWIVKPFKPEALVAAVQKLAGAP